MAIVGRVTPLTHNCKGKRLLKRKQIRFMTYSFGVLFSFVSFVAIVFYDTLIMLRKKRPFKKARTTAHEMEGAVAAGQHKD